MPAVSIVVPVYKVEKYLERCLKSIIEQPFKDYELILIDDGSPDKCGIICDRYTEIYDFIKVIHKKNAGLGYARNSGIDIAEGDYITFIDSDDYIENDLIGDLYRNAVKNQADTVIAAHSREKGGVKTVEENPIAGRIFTKSEIFENVLQKMVGTRGDGSDFLNMAAWRVLYSMKIIRENNLKYPSEREFVSEDIIFDLYYYKYANKVCGISNPGYVYCMNPDSLTERYNPERYEKGEILYKEKKKILSSMKKYDGEAKYRTEESFLRYSRYAIKSEVKYSSDNGWKTSKNNIKRIMNSPTFLECLKTHRNPKKSKTDVILDILTKYSMAGVALIMLKIGYFIRSRM